MRSVLRALAAGRWPVKRATKARVKPMNTGIRLRMKVLFLKLVEGRGGRTGLGGARTVPEVTAEILARPDDWRLD
jgi:hypothetical protein